MAHGPSKPVFRTCAVAMMLGALSQGPAFAQSFVGSPEEIAAFAIDACGLETTENLADQLAAKIFAGTEAGLALRYSDDNTALFGLPGDVELSISTTIDSLSCDMRLPPELGTADTYDVIEAAITAAIDDRAAQYDNVIPSDQSDPSPHVEGYSWTIFTTQKDIFAIQLLFETETGVRIFGGIRKNYE